MTCEATMPSIALPGHVHSCSGGHTPDGQVFGRIVPALVLPEGSVTMAVNWDDTQTWGTHVHESEWGTLAPREDEE